MGAIVCKFGGTSVADAEQIRKIETIVRDNPKRRYIIVSALGSRGDGDQKITDLLLLCYDLAHAGLDVSEPFHIIRDRHLELAEDLGVDLDVSRMLDELREQIESRASRDFVASRGEFLSAQIIASYMGGSLSIRWMESFSPRMGTLMKVPTTGSPISFPKMRSM